MNNAKLAAHPPHKILGLKLLLAMLGVYWVCLLPFTTEAQPAGAAGVKLLLACACGLLALCGHAHVAALARGAAVLACLRTPDTVWRLWFAEAMRDSMRVWGLLLTALTIQLALPGTTMHVASGAALLSLSLALGVLFSLARAGWLARPVVLLCLVGAGALLAALATLGVRQGLAVTLDALGALPAPLLLAMLLSWPALSLWMKRRWGRVPPRPRWRAPTAPRGLAQRIGAHLQRYQVLRWDPQDQPLATPPHRGSTMLALALLATATPTIALLLVSTPAVWGGPLRLQHLIALTYISMFKVSTLVARDLHWRFMLRPGGGRATVLVKQLLLPNLGVLLMTLLPCALAYATLQYGWQGQSPVAILQAIGAHTPILFELLFVTCASLAVRTLTIPPWAFSLYIALPALGFAGLLIHLGDRMAPLFNAGPGYALALLAGSLALLAVARRRWTTRRLAPFLRAG